MEELVEICSAGCHNLQGILVLRFADFAATLYDGLKRSAYLIPVVRKLFIQMFADFVFMNGVLHINQIVHILGNGNPLDSRTQGVNNLVQT